MWNNTKGEQDNLCLALINPRLCKKLSIKVAVEQHDTKTTVPYLHVFLDNTWNLKNCAFIRLDKRKRQIASTVTFSGGCFAATDI